MRFGLTPEEYLFIAVEVVEPLRKQGAVVWCFGSRARGDNHTFSDLDLMVECDQDLSATIAGLKDLLEESNFPYKVDLVQKRFFASSYLPKFERDKVAF